MPTYLDENGEPVKQYLDENGEPIAGPPQQAGFKGALASAEQIGGNPWYTRSLGPEIQIGSKTFQPIPSVTQALSVLPDVFGAVGGIAAGAGAVPGTGGLGVPLAAAAGAAAGGGLGETVRQAAMRAITGKAPEGTGPLSQLKAAGVQAASELGGRAIGSLGRLLNPGRGAIDPAVAEAAERTAGWAAREGQAAVELPASALSTAKVVPVAETIAGTGPFGSKVGKRYRSALLRLTALADHTVARASKATDDSSRGLAMAKGLEAYKKAFREESERMYEDVAADLPTVTVAFPQTAELLQGFVARKSSAGKAVAASALEDFPFYKDTLAKYVGKKGQLRSKSLVDVKNALQELDQAIDWSFADPKLQRNEAMLRELRRTLKGEYLGHLDQMAPDAAALLRKADKAYAENIAKIDSVFGENINRLHSQGRYDLIGAKIANRSMSADDIPRIVEVVGPEGADAMRAGVIANILDKATLRGSTPSERSLTPKALSVAMNGFGLEKLKALLTADQYQRLSDIATMSFALEKGTRVMGGTMTLPMTRLTGEMAAVAAAPTKPRVLAGVLGLGLFESFVGSKAGQKWLTTGWPRASRAVTAVGRQAPRAGVAAYDVNRQRERERAAQER
jgi:hypothetical protein